MSKPAKNRPPELWTIDDLKKAIDNDEFTIYVHPIYSFLTGTAVGGEILTHWEKNQSDPDPEGFFPKFDEEEMCSELDFYILTETLRMMCRNAEGSSAKLFVSFNLSNPNFRSYGFVDRINDLVEAFEIDKKRVRLEVKEELLISGKDNVYAQLEELRGNGFRIIADNVTDDTRLLPLIEGRKVDAIKLEQKYIMSIAAERGYGNITNLMAVTRRNNIDVICSRIETAEQKEFAARAGCSMVQGYLMAKLVLLDEFLK